MQKNLQTYRLRSISFKGAPCCCAVTLQCKNFQRAAARGNIRFYAKITKANTRNDAKIAKMNTRFDAFFAIYDILFYAFMGFIRYVSG